MKAVREGNNLCLLVHYSQVIHVQSCEVLAQASSFKMYSKNNYHTAKHSIYKAHPLPQVDSPSTRHKTAVERIFYTCLEVFQHSSRNLKPTELLPSSHSWPQYIYHPQIALIVHLKKASTINKGLVTGHRLQSSSQVKYQASLQISHHSTIQNLFPEWKWQD